MTDDRRAELWVRSCQEQPPEANHVLAFARAIERETLREAADETHEMALISCQYEFPKSARQMLLEREWWLRARAEKVSK